MASESYPNASHNSGAVTTAEWEQLAAAGVGTGLVGSPGDTAVVYADSSGRQVKIRSGKRAVVRGAAWYSGSTDITVPIAANTSGATRIDRVVLRLTKASGEVTEEVVTGTPGAGAPALTKDLGTTGVYEFPLAQVRVVDGASTLAAGTVVREGWHLAPNPVVLHSAPSLTGETAPLVDGQLAYEQPNDRVWMLVNGGWRLLWQDSGLVHLTPSSGWSVGSHGAWVESRITVVTFQAQFVRTGSTISSGAAKLCQLPDGLEPVRVMLVNAYLYGSHPALVRFNTNGSVEMTSYAEPTAAGDYVVIPAFTYQINS